jgi:hypothetical protein
MLPLKDVNNKTPIQNKRQVCMTNYRTITLLTALSEMLENKRPLFSYKQHTSPRKIWLQEECMH